MKSLWTVRFTILFAALSGCVLTVGGRNFQPVNASTMVIGKTTKAAIFSQYGPPDSTGQELVNGKMISKLHYFYAAHDGAANSTYKRHAWFYFSGETFVGYMTATGFPEEQRDFDEKKVPLLVKGKTTRDEVVTMFGAPEGSVAYPATPEKKSDEGDSAVLYSYELHVGVAFTSKFLYIIFDPAGVVKDVTFEINQKGALPRSGPNAWPGYHIEE